VNRGTANQVEKVILQAEQNDIPDNVPLVSAGDLPRTCRSCDTTD
jgi:hypothetical protein